MSRSPDTIPTTINSSTKINWPNDLPDAPPFEQTDEASEPVNVVEPDTSHWTEIAAEQAARLPHLRGESVKRYIRHIYSQLKNSTINWELDAPYEACRVVGLLCQGKVYNSMNELGQHLKCKQHMEHDAASVLQSPTAIPAPKPPTVLEMLQRPTKKP